MSNFSIWHNVFRQVFIYKILISLCTQLLTILKKKALENTVGKRRKCWEPAFSPFLTVFSIKKVDHQQKILLLLVTVYKQLTKYYHLLEIKENLGFF